MGRKNLTSVMVAIRSLKRPCSISVSSIFSLIGGILNTALAPTRLVYPSGNIGSDSILGVLFRLVEKFVKMLRRRFKGVHGQFLRLISEFCVDVGV